MYYEKSKVIERCKFRHVSDFPDMNLSKCLSGLEKDTTHNKVYFWSLRNGKALLIKEMFWSNAIRLVSGIRMSLHWFTSNKDPRILLWASSTTTCSGSLPHRTYETRANYRTASWPSVARNYIDDVIKPPKEGSGKLFKSFLSHKF